MRRSEISNSESANQEALECEKLQAEEDEAPAPAKVAGAFGTASESPRKRASSARGKKQTGASARRSP